MTALDEVTIDVQRGAVHALVGENGAGKSTLMRVLSGAVVPDRGFVEVDGVRADFASPRDAHRAGIRMIHQELSLIPELSVAENIFLGIEPNRRGILDRSTMRSEAAAMLDSLGEDIDPAMTVGDLPLARREMVEIAKALAAGTPRVLILDEPTAILSVHETEALFARVRALARSGVAILYCSHRLDEIDVLANQVTVLRDGRVVGRGTARQWSRDALIQLMVGRPVATNVFRSPGEPPTTNRPVRLRVDRLTSDAIEDVSLTVESGELVALVGLVGAGRTEVARAIIGADRRVAGTVSVDDAVVDPHSPRDALRAGIGYVSEDRKGAALIPQGTVSGNMTLARLRQFSRGRFVPIIDRARERATAEGWAAKLRIKGALDRSVTTLSGGNQQKVVLARWLIEGIPPLRVLIVDEPTRGVDVGARAEIYGVLRDVTARGTAVLAITSDLEEAMAIADRVLVMRQGRLIAALAPPLTAAQIAGLMVPA